MATPASAAPQLEVDPDGYELISSQRLDRTRFRLTYRATIVNAGSRALAVAATVASDSPATVIEDDGVSFGEVGAAAAVASSDTFSLVQDRLARFDPAVLRWSVVFDAAPVPSVTIVEPGAFLTGAGQFADLSAQVLDEQGLPLPAAVTWISSDPDQVEVDAQGRVTALAIGSALIYAEAEGVRSAPVFVFVAEPQPGALLVADAQVAAIGPPLGLPEGEPPGVGTQYEVWLSGLAAPPAAGTVVLAAETAQVAGKVVATRDDGGLTALTLELVPLYELLARYHFDWSVPLAEFPLEPLGPAPAPGELGLATEPIEPFRAVACEGKVEAALAKQDVSLSVLNGMNLDIQDFRDDPTLPPGFSRHALTGSFTLEGKAGFEFKPGVEFTGSCVAQANVKLRTFALLSLFVAPAIRLGVGVELEGKLEVAKGALSITGKLGTEQTLGWECGGPAGPACRSLDDFRLISEYTPKVEVPRADQMHVELSGHFFALLGLDFAVTGLGQAQIVEAKYGPKQSGDFGLEPDQATNEGYASSYELQLEGSVEPGKGLKAAIKKLIDDDGVGVTFKGKLPTVEISKSPRGTFTADRARVGLGEEVEFGVDLEPATTSYFALGYNVVRVELWRKRESENEFTRFEAFDFTQSNQSRFTRRWKPGPEDLGKTRFAAFVATQLPVPSLEVNPDSVREVDVRCFSSGTQLSPPVAAAPPKKQKKRRAKAKRSVATPLLAPLATNVCADVWRGSASHLLPGIQSSDASITWNRDPTAVGDPGQVFYVASGTVTFHYLVWEGLGCTVTPTSLPLGRDTGDVNSLVVDYAFTPPKFAGHGQMTRTVTISCPDADPFEASATIPWFDGAGDVSEDGLRIEGSVSTPVGGSSFVFVRP